MDDDWDLQAVVRSCSASTSSNSAATSSVSGSQQYFSFSSDITPDQFESSKRGNSNSVVPVQELHDLYKPFYPNLQTISAQSLPISPLSVLSGLQDLSYEQNNQPLLKQATQQAIQQTHVKQKQPSFSVVNGSTTTTTTTKAHTSNSRSKRRKNNMKRVCHVAAENLSSDTWSWRKYGQKPIKGSPYPRGYYRCSTSKGCMARKQVERNRSDPAMFIVTYTAEHNHPMPTHRNSLAGSTRNKPAETTTNPDSTNKPSCSSEMSPGPSRSPGKEKLESSRDDLAEQEDDDFSISNMALDDDFFTGLEDFTKDECFSDHFPTSPQLPWVGTTSAG